VFQNNSRIIYILRKIYRMYEEKKEEEEYDDHEDDNNNNKLSVTQTTSGKM